MNEKNLKLYKTRLSNKEYNKAHDVTKTAHSTFVFQLGGKHLLHKLIQLPFLPAIAAEAHGILPSGSPQPFPAVLLECIVELQEAAENRA
jgi:hypothetical protein